MEQEAISVELEADRVRSFDVSIIIALLFTREAPTSRNSLGVVIHCKPQALVQAIFVQIYVLSIRGRHLYSVSMDWTPLASHLSVDSA